MSLESRHRKLEELFLECADLPAHERTGFLEGRCGGLIGHFNDPSPL
jgi:hypothetical protein